MLKKQYLTCHHFLLSLLLSPEYFIQNSEMFPNMKNMQSFLPTNKSKIGTPCLSVTVTRGQRQTQVKHASFTTRIAFWIPNTQYKGRKEKSAIFRLTHENIASHYTDKIWQKSNFEEKAREQQADAGELALGLLFIFSLK